jgi:hypothetical protein
VEGYLYQIYYTMFEHNERLERNWRLDYLLLAYLLWADIVVSDDQRFFRAVFEALWKPRGKRMESAEGFATLLSGL